MVLNLMLGKGSTAGHCVGPLDATKVCMFYNHLKGTPVSIYIEDEETCQLANELAQLTGETVADAVTVAVRERLERQREIAERVQELHAIGEHCAKLLRPGPSAVEHGDFLYDEDGLPR